MSTFANNLYKLRKSQYNLSCNSKYLQKHTNCGIIIHVREFIRYIYLFPNIQTLGVGNTTPKDIFCPHVPLY